MRSAQPLHWNFIHRQLTTTRQQSLIFILCVALSIVTLVGLNSLGASINQTLLSDARELMAADLMIDSRYALAEATSDAISDLEARGLAEATLITSLFTVARSTQEDASLFSELKIVEEAYPFYGVVELGSGRALHDVLRPGTIIVEPLLLDRLGLQIGDQLRLGEATLRIGDTLLSEPDRPINFFAFGPHILVSPADLPSLKLIVPGSRVDYRTLLKVPNEANLAAIAEELKAVADPDLEEIETFRSRESGLQRFFDNLLFFLSMVAIFTLLLAGIGIQSALVAFLRERDNTIAILRTVGATGRFVTRHFAWIVAILGIIGTLIGLAGGVALQRLFPWLLAGFLPPDVALTLSPRVVVESLALGITVVAIFTFLPLDRLKELRPSFILRKETSSASRGVAFFATLALLILIFAGLVFLQFSSFKRTLYFVLGVLGLVLIIAGITEAILFLLRRQKIHSLPLRQALRGLFRPRNATRAVVITLASALAVVFTIYLAEQNLDNAFVRSYPEDSPNVFFIDIQPQQLDDFNAFIEDEVEGEIRYFPVVRGQIVSINGEPIDREKERERRGENLARQFSLTYRDELLDDEAILIGDTLFDPAIEGVQVSILDDLLDLRDFAIGDRISYRIQGIPMDATISSIRTRTDESIRPFFNFVFRTVDLQAAPQTIFTAVTIPEEAIASLQNRVVATFPNISVIDGTEAVAAFADVVRRLSQVIRFLTIFSIAAGLLIIVSSVYATRFARIQEAVYFKVLGAEGRFVLRVFALENFILGLFSAVVALLLAQVATWLVTRWVFDISYTPFILASIIMLIGTVLLVMTIGLLASIPILQQRPIRFLREQSQE